MGVKSMGLGLSMLALVAVATFAANDALGMVDAMERKDSETVRSLLKQHVNVNTAQADGATALTWAAHWDDPPTTDLLIHAGANVNATNDYGSSPLWEACNN